MATVGVIRKLSGNQRSEIKLTRKQLPYTIGMVVLDIAAPIFLMIALMLFQETISKRLWLAIRLIVLSSTILSVEDMSSFSFSFGSLFVLLACICWGLENNCTRVLSEKDPLQIVVIKGFGSGAGSLVIAMAIGEPWASSWYIIGELLLGFVAYGLSIFFYVHAQRELGAAKTSAYYAIAPFIGVALSLIIFREIPSITFVLALVIMLVGTYFASTDFKKN